MQKRTDWYISSRSWLVIDALIAVASVIFAYFFTKELNVSWSSSFPGQPSAYGAAVGYAIFLTLSADVVGLHDPLRQRRFWPLFARLMMAVASGSGVYLLFLYVFFLGALGRSVGFQIAIMTFVSMFCIRMILWRVESSFKRRLVLLLDEKRRFWMRDIINQSGLPFEVVDLALSRSNEKELLDFCRLNCVDEVVIDGTRKNDTHGAWLNCLEEGIQVSSDHSFLERYFYKVSCDRIGVNWLLALDLRLTHPVYHRWKRLFDVVVSFIGLLVSSPFFCISAVAILIETGRPIFYKQSRVGLRGKKFTIWKLRTMRLHSVESESRWAGKKDRRVTKIGYLLRRTRFDEIPQFWNILKGDMSMIGPRPEWTDIAELWSEKISLYRYRHLVKPGLTGWAQINYPYAVTEEDVVEKLSFDFYYMKHASVLLDFQIILRTIAAIMNGSR